MRSVTRAVVVRVVFVNGNRPRPRTRPRARICSSRGRDRGRGRLRIHRTLGAFQDYTPAGPVVSYQVLQVRTLGCAVLRVAVIVVQAGAIAQYSVASFLGHTHARTIGRVELGVIGIGGQVV